MQMLYFSEVQLSVPEPSQATHLPSAAARLATHFSSAAPLQANYLPSAAHPQSTNFPSALHPQPTNLLTAHLPGQPISHQRTATDLPHPTVYPRAINRSSAAPLRPPIYHQQHLFGQVIPHEQQKHYEKRQPHHVLLYAVLWIERVLD